jgi:NADP-dependent 3-hydroxy acid dehydrogenase YdfG
MPLTSTGTPSTNRLPPSFPPPDVLRTPISILKRVISITSQYAFDGLVNNVGLVQPQKLGAIELDDLDPVVALNLQPAVQSAQALLPGMREAWRGRIVDISSLTVRGIAPWRISIRPTAQDAIRWRF